MAADELLKMVQHEVPIAKKPYMILAERLEMGEDDVLNAVKDMVDRALIRRVAIKLTPASIEMHGALVAISAEPERIEQIAEKINSYTEVSHNYQREHEFQMWFTVKTESEVRYRIILDEVRHIAGIKQMAVFPARKVFKLDIGLDSELYVIQQPVRKLTSSEFAVLSTFINSVPIESRPFYRIAEKVGMEENELVAWLLKLKEEHIVERMKAVTDPKKLGYSHSYLLCFNIEHDIDYAASNLSAYRCVSHCYERYVEEGPMQYNLFVMTHFRSIDEYAAFRKDMDDMRYEYVSLRTVKQYKRGNGYETS